MVLLIVLTCCTKEQERRRELERAQAAASASAAAAAAALSAALASASAAPKPSAKPEPPPEWITCQHILVAYKGAKAAPRSVTRTKEEARKRAQEAHAKARDPKLDFTDLVILYSDDLATKDRQGNLGKIKRENVVKEFADAAFALKVDEVSDVVETPFGFHIIKRNQ
jgi:hypothetical protein